jgi:hypothetical protein
VFPVLYLQGYSENFWDGYRKMVLVGSCTVALIGERQYTVSITINSPGKCLKPDSYKNGSAREGG